MTPPGRVGPDERSNRAGKEDRADAEMQDANAEAEAENEAEDQGGMEADGEAEGEADGAPQNGGRTERELEGAGKVTSLLTL